MGLIFLFLVAGFMFLFVVFSGQTDIGYLFDFTRHEWYRELRRDYFTSRAQFWREWRSLKRFAKANGPWIYATFFGTLGLVLTVILLIVNLPQELKARVRDVYAERAADGQSLLVTREDTIDTRKLLRDSSPLEVDSGLPMFVDVRQAKFETIARAEEPPEPRVVEPVGTPQPTPRAREDIDLDAAFADFVLERTPEPEPEVVPPPVLEPGIELEITRVNEVTSTAVVDVEAMFVRLAGDRWEPEDTLRVPRPPQKPPVLYRDRHNDVQLSQHERVGADGSSDLIRLRPRAFGSEIAPGLLVRKSISHRAVAGQSMTYEIEVTNPHAETVPGIIVEEIVPSGWSIVNATPRAVLVDDETLRWSINDLEANQSHRFKVEVVVGSNEAAQSRTVVTAGAAVKSVINVDAAKLAPDPVTIEPAPVIVNDSGWQASRSRITLPNETNASPPALPPGRVSVRKSATLQVDTQPRVGLGPVEVRFTVKNVGSVRLENPILLVWLQKELTHQTGRRDIQFRVGALEPQTSRTITLRLTANAVGAVSNRVQLQDWVNGGQLIDRELLIEDKADFTIETGSTSGVEPISYSRWRAVGSR